MTPYDRYTRLITTLIVRFRVASDSVVIREPSCRYLTMYHRAGKLNESGFHKRGQFIVIQVYA